MILGKVELNIVIPYETLNINDEFFDTNKLKEVGEAAARKAIADEAAKQFNEAVQDGTLPEGWRIERD